MLQNSKNHLTILRLIFLCSNLQIWATETRILKMLNLTDSD
ncbi:MAG: hypothetical protein ACFNUU_04680 [Campylobacter sp.]